MSYSISQSYYNTYYVKIYNMCFVVRGPLNVRAKVLPTNSPNIRPEGALF